MPSLLLRFSKTRSMCSMAENRPFAVARYAQPVVQVPSRSVTKVASSPGNASENDSLEIRGTQKSFPVGHRLMKLARVSELRNGRSDVTIKMLGAGSNAFVSHRR